MKLFSYDSPVSQVLLKLSWCCYLNLLWLLCSLPVFTMGASTTALYAVTLKIVQEKEGNLTAQFFRAFRENFRQATVLWLILLGTGVLLAGDGYILYHLFRTSSGIAAVLWTLVSALVIAAALACGVVLLYVFPLTASVVNTSGAMLKNAFLIGTHYLFCTLLVAGIHFAMFYLVVAVFTPVVIFGEGLCALLSSYLLSGVIRACASDPNASPEQGSPQEQGGLQEQGIPQEHGIPQEQGGPQEWKTPQPQGNAQPKGNPQTQGNPQEQDSENISGERLSHGETS